MQATRPDCCDEQTSNKREEKTSSNLGYTIAREKESEARMKSIAHLLRSLYDWSPKRSSHSTCGNIGCNAMKKGSGGGGGGVYSNKTVIGGLGGRGGGGGGASKIDKKIKITTSMQTITATQTGVGERVTAAVV